ncbi:MAG TPA: response regulator, partial [Segetibacter sp.]
MINKYKILHLEDLPTDAELTARELRKSNINFEHFVVDNEKSFSQALDTYAPDIILCDHSISNFNSTEALAIFKCKKLDIPFIIITATLTDEVAMSVLKKGADDYILKDRLKRLPFAVINAVERFRLERERKKLVDETEKKEALSIKNLSDLSNK